MPVFGTKEEQDKGSASGRKPGQSPCYGASSPLATEVVGRSCRFMDLPRDGGRDPVRLVGLVIIGLFCRLLAGLMLNLAQIVDKEL